MLYDPLTQYSFLSPSPSHSEPLLFTVPPPIFMTYFFNDTFYLIRVAGMSMGGRLFIEQEQLDTSEDYHFSFHITKFPAVAQEGAGPLESLSHP